MITSCSDLNPNNLLLDEANNILLSYFCALDCQYRRLDAVCRDTCYCAPGKHLCSYYDFVWCSQCNLLL